MKPIGTGEFTSASCGTCGRFDSARWTLWVESDELRHYCDHRAKYRLCEACYRRHMQHLLATPDHDPTRPLRGYT